MYMDSITEMYERYVNDDSILSLLQLAKIYDIIPENATGGSLYRKFCKSMYNQYGCEHIKSIGISRRARNAGNGNKKYKGLTYDDIYGNKKAIIEKQKRSRSIKKSWDIDDGTRREISKNNMIIHCNPVSSEYWVRDKALITRHKNEKWANYTDDGYANLVEKNRNKIVSDQTRERQSKSAIARGYNLPDGFTHSDKTKKLISDKITELWERGIYTPTFKSKGHAEIEEIINTIGYDVVCEYNISGKYYDIYIPELNIIIEYNGTYWHYDPRIYDSGYYDVSRDRYVDTVWKYDEKKIQLSLDNGYTTIVIWQLDFESLNYNDKIKFIKNIIEND